MLLNAKCYILIFIKKYHNLKEICTRTLWLHMNRLRQTPNGISNNANKLSFLGSFQRTRIIMGYSEGDNILVCIPLYPLNWLTVRSFLYRNGNTTKKNNFYDVESMTVIVGSI